MLITFCPRITGRIHYFNLLKAGGDPRLTTYPEAGHHSWIEAFANPEL